MKKKIKDLTIGDLLWICRKQDFKKHKIVHNKCSDCPIQSVCKNDVQELRYLFPLTEKEIEVE